MTPYAVSWISAAVVGLSSAILWLLAIHMAWRRGALKSSAAGRLLRYAVAFGVLALATTLDAAWIMTSLATPGGEMTVPQLLAVTTGSAPIDQVIEDLTVLQGVGSARQKALQELGLYTIAQVATADPATIDAAVNGISADGAERLVSQAQALLAGHTTAAQPKAAKFWLPFDGDYRLVQRFGANPTKYWRFGLPGHDGVDYVMPEGTPILAAGDGVVVRTGWDEDGYGNYVTVRHRAGDETLYAHLSEVTVREGQAVNPASVLGYSGNTGNSSAPHLHIGYHPLQGGATGYKGWDDPQGQFELRTPTMWVAQGGGGDASAAASTVLGELRNWFSRVDPTFEGVGFGVTRLLGESLTDLWRGRLGIVATLQVLAGLLVTLFYWLLVSQAAVWGRGGHSVGWVILSAVALLHAAMVLLTLRLGIAPQGWSLWRNLALLALIFGAAFFELRGLADSHMDGGRTFAWLTAASGVVYALVFLMSPGFSGARSVALALPPIFVAMAWSAERSCTLEVAASGAEPTTRRSPRRKRSTPPRTVV